MKRREKGELSDLIRKLARCHYTIKEVSEKTGCYPSVVKRVLARKPQKRKPKKVSQKMRDPLPEDAISDQLARALGL